ncbi:MAG: hypothetical protein JO107_03115 [Hyphomicrobiales bacterium]|nr:hypothetical protein [Hyphomicrobiales bacterium]
MTRGFGTTLIEQTVKGKGGSARRSFEANGIHWEIVLPLASDEEAPDAGSDTHKSSAQTGTPVASTRTKIKGKRFAVIEDEPLIAVEIASVLQQEGAQVSGPVATVSDALRIIEDSALDGALVDANLRGQPYGDIAAALTRKGIPFVFVTGYSREALPSSFARAKILKKPFTEAQLLKEAAQLVEQPVSDAAL